MIKCSFCGNSFLESQGVASCKGCPMSKTCNKIKCPHCGFETLKEPGIIKFFRKIWGKKQ
jgi:rubredoxin